MTRKQYEEKIRQVYRGLNEYTVNQGYEPMADTETVGTPHWGEEITVGRHKGKKLRSYQQAWDIIWDVLHDTPAMKGISYD